MEKILPKQNGNFCYCSDISISAAKHFFQSVTVSPPLTTCQHMLKNLQLSEEKTRWIGGTVGIFI